jgi:hypothetical protein
LRGLCLFKNRSDGVSYRWGHKEKLLEPQSAILVLRHSDMSGGASGSLDLALAIPEESPESLEEQAFINRNLIQRSFVTSQHSMLFDSMTLSNGSK